MDEREVGRLIRAAALSCYGVSAVHGQGWPGRLAARFGLGRGGIDVQTRPHLRVRLNLQLASSVPRSQVAANVVEAVRYAVQRDLGRTIDELTVLVDGLPVTPGGGP